MPHLQPVLSFDAGAPAHLPFRLHFDVPGVPTRPDMLLISGAVQLGLADLAGLLRGISHALDDLALAQVDRRPEDIVLPSVAQSAGTLADGLNLVARSHAAADLANAVAPPALSLVKDATNG